MKNLLLTIILLLLISVFNSAEGQLKNLDKRIEQKVIRKIDQKADRTIDKTLDKGEKAMDKEVKEAVKGDSTDNDKAARNTQIKKTGESSSESDAAKSPDNFAAYTKFDFMPGEKVIFFDDFSHDNTGDFPLKWDTNGSGEVVTTNSATKWFELKPNSFYIPQIKDPLSENYTIEFDLHTSELDKKLSSTSFIQIILDDNSTFNLGKNFSRVKLPYCQYIPGDIHVESRVGGKELINNKISEDVRKKMLDGSHISISVNKKRFRLWMDEKKVIDIPTLVPENAKNIKFTMQGFSQDFKNYHYYIGNVKIAEGKSDIRSRLVTEGKLVTNGILFDINSDRIKPESYGLIKQIAGVLKENESIRIKIVGHTDADGDDQNNLELSKRRALSVKSILSSEYQIAENRMEADGKGENDPFDKRNTPEGKANNRRVEFVKL